MKRWWQSRTVRFRLAAWYGFGGTLLLAAFSGTIYLYVADRMAQPLDHQLRADLTDLERRLTVSTDGRVRWDGQEIDALQNWASNDPWFELWNENGQLIRRLWPFSEARVSQLPVAPATGRETISVFPVAEDIRLRVLSVPYHVPGRERDWMIRVMRMHEPVADALQALLVIIGASLPVVITILVLGGYSLTRRWLKPLDDMVAEAHRITAEDLSRRLPVSNPSDELGRLATVFNFTLDRLEDSFTTLDRFVSDASHELLTPLTTLRSVGEVGLRAARRPEDYQEIIGSMLEEAQRLQLLVEKILQLARAEGGSDMLQCSRVQLDDLARHCAEDATILAEEKNQRIVVDAAPCLSDTDPLLLRQALQNLVDNGMKYSPPGSVITIKVRETPMGNELAVMDDGHGVQSEHRARLTDRFFRAEDSRGLRRGGFGLGLAITKAYMRVLKGSLHFEPALPHGSIFRLTLPKSTDAEKALGTAAVKQGP